jgi:acyl carrier protein
MDDIQSKLSEFIRKQYMIPEDDANFTPDAQLFDAGYIDSFGMNDLIAFIEKEFGFKIEDRDISQGVLDSIANMAAAISKKRAT